MLPALRVVVDFMNRIPTKEARGLWFLSVLIAGIVFYISLLSISDCKSFSYVYTGLASLIMLALFVLGKYHSALWFELAPDSKLLWIYERGVLPATVIVSPYISMGAGFFKCRAESLIPVKSFEVLLVIISGIVLFVILLDLGYKCRDYIRLSKNQAERSGYAELIFLHVPPTKRSDLIILDLLVVCFLFGPLVIFI